MLFTFAEDQGSGERTLGRYILSRFSRGDSLRVKRSFCIVDNDLLTCFDVTGVADKGQIWLRAKKVFSGKLAQPLK